MIIPVTWVWCSLLPGASPPHQRCLLHYPSNLTLNSSNCRKKHPSTSQVQWTDGAGSTLSKLMASDCFPGLFSTEVLVLLVYSTAVDWNLLSKMIRLPSSCALWTYIALIHESLVSCKKPLPVLPIIWYTQLKPRFHISIVMQWRRTLNNFFFNSIVISKSR